MRSVAQTVCGGSLAADMIGAVESILALDAPASSEQRDRQTGVV
jgi:hypothetical protein